MLLLFPVLPLHAGGVDPTGWLWSDWNVEPTIAIGLLVLAAGYLFLTGRTSLTPLPPSPIAIGEGGIPGDAGVSPTSTSRLPPPASVLPPPATRHPPPHRVSFLAGLIVLFVALGPPLDDWSDHYLLTAHMVQHLLLTLLAAPLLLSGIPGWMLAPLTRNRVTNAIGYWLTRPIIAFALANTVFILWHLPMLYEAALRAQPVHVAEHMTMLVTAMIAWWPIVGPLPQWPRLPLPLHSLYFFAMTIPGSAVGAFITFADPGLYAPYDTAPRVFGIDLATDQQAAGLLMWVAVSTIYLLLITVSFFRWASREEDADRPAARAAAAGESGAPVAG